MAKWPEILLCHTKMKAVSLDIFQARTAKKITADHQVVFDGEGRPKERKLLLSLLLALHGRCFSARFQTLREVSILRTSFKYFQILQIGHMKSANIIDINRMKSLIQLHLISNSFTASAWHNQPGLVFFVGNSPSS